MRLALLVATLFLVLNGMGCAKTDPGPSAAEIEAKGKKKEEDLQKLYDRKDEFAAMKAPLKPQKQYFAKNSFIMFKMPGLDYEVIGWEKDSGGKMKLCGFDKCNERNIMAVRDRLPKEGTVNSVVRADCKPGKRLGELEIVGIGVGSLYESACEVTVIDLATNTTVATGQIVTAKPRTDSGGKIDDRLLINSADKKSKLVVPINEINDFLHSLTS